MATFYTNSFEGRQLSLDVWQDGEYACWRLNCYGGIDKWYTVYNLSVSINGVSVYAPGTVNWNTQSFPAAVGSTSGSVHIGGSTGNRDIYCSFIGNVYYAGSPQNGGWFTMGATIYKPSLSGISLSSITDKSVYASFYVTANNGQAPYSPYIDISESNFGSVVSSFSSRGGTFNNLKPNKTYYVRGNDANDAGRSYTGVASFTTKFNNPGAPGKPVLSCDKSAFVPSAKLTAAWVGATGGSTPVSGYRIRLFKNGTEVFNIDTDSTSTTYTFNTFESYGFVVGDTAKIGIYSYSKDWNNGKHFNGNGQVDSQVFSDTVTILSDKFVYVSTNGGNFTKRKLYTSSNGSEFKEIRKEKFKVIGG